MHCDASLPPDNLGMTKPLRAASEVARKDGGTWGSKNIEWVAASPQPTQYQLFIKTTSLRPSVASGASPNLLTVKRGELREFGVFDATQLAVVGRQADGDEERTHPWHQRRKPLPVDVHEVAADVHLHDVARTGVVAAFAAGRACCACGGERRCTPCADPPKAARA